MDLFSKALGGRTETKAEDGGRGTNLAHIVKHLGQIRVEEKTGMGHLPRRVSSSF